MYVDGFNFYYGLRRGSWRQYYWLDIIKLFESFLRPGQELLVVKYFSAHTHDLEKSMRQNVFFQANQENPKFELVLGKFMKKKFPCPYCQQKIRTYEEKESDVNLATTLVDDAHCGAFDTAILVSADGDMSHSVEIVKRIGRKVYIYFPPNQRSASLAQLDGNPLYLGHWEARFKRALLPDALVQQRTGFVLRIPEKWRAYRGGNGTP